MSTLLKLLFVVLSAAGVVLVVLGLGRTLQVLGVRRRLMPRVRAVPQVSQLDTSEAGRKGSRGVIDMLSRLSLPQKGWKHSAMQMRFIRAGWRDPRAAQIYFALKTALALGSALVSFFLMRAISPAASTAQLLIAMLSLALITNFVPDIYLRLRTQQRVSRMQDALPDLLDLLVICSESGLGMDAAISKVARDMAPASPELAEEFYLMALEIRAGEARTTALRNLALRVDLMDLHDLVSMLIQADRFGTSLAVSLRIQSEVMRNKRMQRAEEIAAKIPTKMLIPLVLFIFPVLLLVLLGPAIMQLSKAFAF